MRRVGLTGGIASGKSTVTQMFRDLGADVVDADVVARAVVAPGTPGLAAVAERFPGVLTPEGTLDRARLRERVFAQDLERLALNQLLHPRIQRAVDEAMEKLAAQGTQVVLYDAPLLIENGLERQLDGVILVTVPLALQLARLRARDALTQAQAEARVATQLPLEEKKAHATWQVDNSGTLAQTEQQVAAIWASLRTGP